MRVFVAGAASWGVLLHLDALPTGPGTSLAATSYEAIRSTGTGKAPDLARRGHDVLLHTLPGGLLETESAPG